MDQKEIKTKILDYLSQDNTIGFEQVSNMVEFLQCYPLIVRKNKNASAQMESVMNTAAKGREELSDAAKLMMYVWTKLCDQSKNIAQTFRIFDTKDKGKLSKADF